MSVLKAIFQHLCAICIYSPYLLSISFSLSQNGYILNHHLIITTFSPFTLKFPYHWRFSSVSSVSTSFDYSHWLDPTYLFYSILHSAALDWNPHHWCPSCSLRINIFCQALSRYLFLSSVSFFWSKSLLSDPRITQL